MILSGLWASWSSIGEDGWVADRDEVAGVRFICDAHVHSVDEDAPKCGDVAFMIDFSAGGERSLSTTSHESKGSSSEISFARSFPLDWNILRDTRLSLLTEEAWPDNGNLQRDVVLLRKVVGEREE